MLNKASRNTLRNIKMVFHKFVRNCYFSSESEDTRLDFEETYKANAKMAIPTYDEMRKEIFSKISESGFRIRPVSPKKANCVVRIYRKEFEIDDMPAGLCGADCFVKTLSGKWTTLDSQENIVELSHLRFYPVQYWTSLVTRYDNLVMANYYDIYLKVVKK
ncbi:MAG: hypothetical protein IJW20_03415 [Clostridia bacterium]|nr:hypothetical protein [Clostridia bacterium]